MEDQQEQDKSVISQSSVARSSKYHDIMNFLDSVDQDVTKRSHITNSEVHDKSYTQADISSHCLQVVNPVQSSSYSTRPAADYSQASSMRERLLELEIEKDEKDKLIELI